MATRRRFLQTAAISGAGAYVASRIGALPRLFAQVAGGSLPPSSIPKFASPLFIPPAMPKSDSNATTDFYTIAARQFTQQILPAPMPATTVWGYGLMTDANSFHYPAPTIEALTSRLVRVKWINQLVDGKGKCLSHLFAVDQTLHWANPPGGVNGRDMRGADPKRYRGPVPIVTHLHGQHSGEESDGYPEAWFLPAAGKIPDGYATVGSYYDAFREVSKNAWNVDWDPGSATFTYPNDQRPATLWYHDHTLGMTRLNVYAGLAGFYLLRGVGAEETALGVLPGPAPAEGDGPNVKYYEIPLVIQDRSFNEDGSLFYPDDRAFFEGLRKGDLQIPFIPQQGCTGPSDVSPIWNPEFFGNTMVVNGRTWPYLAVEQRRYRFRILNACDSRFLILTMDNDLPFWHIGSDGGFLAAPVQLSQLLVGPAERADVIVDFTNVPVDTRIVLLNVGPDEPFGGGVPDDDFDTADPGTTGQVMQFRVVAAASADTTTPPASLTLPPRTPLPGATTTRDVSINEAESETVFVDAHPAHGHKNHQSPKIKMLCGDPYAVPFGPTHATLGVVSNGEGVPLPWRDAVTENPAAGATEIWAIHNFTEDAHPIHVHLVQFEVVEREDSLGVTRPPEDWETGTKDTVIAYPGEITRVKATFDRSGRYVWHCHIVSHEDNEMMRPYVVGPIT